MLLIWIFYTAHPSCCFHSCVEVYHTNCLLSAGTTMTSQSFTVTLEPTKVTLNCCAQTYTRTSTMCLSALFICFSRSMRPPLPLSHLSLPPSCGEADKELIYRPIKCRHWNIASNKPDVFTRANWPSTNMFTCWICVRFWVLCVRLVLLCAPCSV